LNTIKHICFTFILFYVGKAFAQSDQILINASLNPETKIIHIQQDIIYHNSSKKNLDTIYLHNWANAYLNKKTKLATRLLENYDKDIYFAKPQDRGYSKIVNIGINHISSAFFEVKNYNDIVGIKLKTPLKSQSSIKISTTYIVKIPNSKFTEYGFNKQNFLLRYWYIVPAVFDTKWHLMSDLNMDDLYMKPSNYTIILTIPEKYKVITDLNVIDKATNKNKITYTLTGFKQTDIVLAIHKVQRYRSYKTDSHLIITDIEGLTLNKKIKKDILQRQIHFIYKYLGKYPIHKILISKAIYDKNPVYGLHIFPKFLHPFSDVFQWDIELFKEMTSTILDHTLIMDRRKDKWLIDGIQYYLMMKYVESYYTEVKAIGNLSTLWGIRRFNFAKLNFNEKYPFVYQFAARKNIDQSLKTSADSLSNFNRKIVNKYKAGLGLRYLNEYLGHNIVRKSLQELYQKELFKPFKSSAFKKILSTWTNKNLDWFFKDYLTTKKKIDYTIKKVTFSKDSLAITIKNNRNFKAPVALYGIQNDSIEFKKWIAPIDSTAIIKIKKGNFNKVSLNYEYLYPEYNLRNNWKNLDKHLFNRPLQFKFFKDIENPYYNQIFYNIYANYNFYDGLLIGPRFYNETILKKKLLYKITPTYGTKSKTFTGSFSLLYKYLPEKTSIYKYSLGVAGSNYHYAPSLSYKTITPFFAIDFKRKSLRDTGGSSLLTRYVIVDKQPNPLFNNPDEDRYNIFNLKYSYKKPGIVKDLRYTAGIQIAKNFSKISLDLRYKKLTDKNRQFDFRLFIGSFIHNNTKTSYFNFSLDKPQDYLFDLNYIGRSETSGFLSQQFVISEGGFKSVLSKKSANQWMITTNESISIWRGIEVYGDLGIFKNKFKNPRIVYDSGIRLNIAPEIFEIYFPIYSKLKWEIAQPNYDTKIRFVLTTNLKAVVNIFKRGFF